MGLSAPWADSIDIIYSHPVKKWLGINPTGLNTPWAEYLAIITFQTAKIN